MTALFEDMRFGGRNAGKHVGITMISKAGTRACVSDRAAASDAKKKSGTPGSRSAVLRFTPDIRYGTGGLKVTNL